MSLKTLFGFSCVLLVLSAHTAGAVERSWIDTGGGLNNWNDAANWNPNDDFAQAGDNALFDQDATYLVIVQSPSAADDITFTDGNVTLGGGTLNTGGVATIDDAFAVGLGDGAIVTLSGATWDNVGDATIGDVGFGTLTINSGGDFEADEVFIGNQVGGGGEVTLTGSGTTLTATRNVNTGIFTIGNNGGTGTINVLDDADLRTTGIAGNDIWVGSGFEPGNSSNVSTGTLNVDGVGSFAETEDLNIGIFGGTGFLNITGGGQIINTDGGTNGTPDTSFGVNDGAGGEKSSGTGVIDGDGSLLRSRAIFVGFNGTGMLTVSGGGEARTLSQGTALGDMIVGSIAGSDGKAAVFGTDTAGTTASLLDVDNSLSIGTAGLGVLLIGQELDGTANGTGALQVDIDIFIGANPNNTADNMLVVDGANATVNAGDVIYVGHAGRGTMNVTGGGVVTNARARVGTTGGGDGTVLVDGRGSQWNMTTDLFVGLSGKGRLTISDGGVVNSGNNALAIGGFSGSDGQITVTGVDDNGTPGNTADDLQSTLDAGITADLFVGGFTGQTNALGKLEILDGGLAIARATNFVGGTSGSDGWLLVSGVNANGFRSTADFDDNPAGVGPNDFTLIGSSAGEGRLEVSDGGLLDAERLEINGGPADATLFGLAQPFNETVLVTGASGGIASEINVLGRIEVGDTRQASMRIEDGAQVISNFTIATGGPSDSLTFIGTGVAADNSSVIVTGVGSKWFDAYDPVGDVQDDNDFVVAGSATGVILDIEAGGTLQTGRGVIARSVGSSGVVTVTGPGSRWDATGMIIGNIGVGTITVSDGGTVVSAGLTELGNNNAAADGTLTVTGISSSYTASTYAVGDINGGEGTIIATLGGTVTATDTVNLATAAGSIGDATIGTVNPGDAIASLDVGNNLNVGGLTGGTGTFDVENSGLVSVTNTLRVFTAGTANLNGGTIETDELVVDQVGDFNFNTGTLRFTGNKTLDAPALDGIFAGAPVPTLGASQQLAIDGAATLDAPLRLNDPSATLSVGTITDLGNLDWDAGTLSITNQNVVVGVAGLLGQSIIVNQNRTLSVPNGSNNITIEAGADLNVIRGGLNTAQTTNNGLLVISNTTDVDFDVDIGSGLTNNGDLVAIDSTIAGAIVNNGAIEMIGNVTFEDSITLAASSSVGFDIDGLSDFDVLTVGGDLSLDGMLDLDVGFSLALGDSFEIIDVAGILSGTFFGLPDNSEVGTFGGVKLFIDYDGGDGNDVVLVAPEFSADFELDGDVDNEDLTDSVDGWEARFGVDLDGLNFLDWQRQLGSGVPPLSASTSASTTIPEPSSLLLVAFGLLALSTRRKRA